jgi:hypothetical protein
MLQETSYQSDLKSRNNIIFLVVYWLIDSILFWGFITSLGFINTYRDAVPFLPTGGNFNSFTSLFVTLFSLSLSTSIVARVFAVLIINYIGHKGSKGKLLDLNWKIMVSLFISSVVMALALTVGLEVIFLNLLNIKRTQIFSLLAIYLFFKLLSYGLTHVLLGKEKKRY